MVIVGHHEYICEEEKRLQQDKAREKYWKRWGPYVSERQWATGKNNHPWESRQCLPRGPSERRLLVGVIRPHGRCDVR
jgi:hypothetical protein